jgi:hypothetical protein
VEVGQPDGKDFHHLLPAGSNSTTSLLLWEISGAVATRFTAASSMSSRSCCRRSQSELSGSLIRLQPCPPTDHPDADSNLLAMLA